MKLAKNVVVPFTRPSERRKKEELAFLPAALEIVETPASPIGRAIAILIATLFCVALGWAYFGKIDIIASAPGKIIPSGRTKVIQPFETGVIRAIRVRDGQNVKAGDVLIELDPTINAAERGAQRGYRSARGLSPAGNREPFARRDAPAVFVESNRRVSSQARRPRS